MADALGPDDPPVLRTTIAQIRDEVRRARMAGRTIGLVPTMGALHEGHAELIRACCREADEVVVSVFVNPTQFGPTEDYQAYPRNLDADRRLCREAGASWIFAPDGRGDVSDRADRHLRRGPRHHRHAGGAPAAGPLPGRRDRRDEALPDRPARPGPLRSEGLSTTAGDPADGRRPEFAGRDPPGADGSRSRRPGPEQPQPLPRCRATAGRAGAVEGPERGG